jgi:2-oxoglutarate dehydrogenase E2 component (dihydrolipoamide succinyltransferase)
MPSPYAGTVLKLHFKEKDLVKVGQALATIGEKGEVPAEAAPAASAPPLRRRPPRPPPRLPRPLRKGRARSWRRPRSEPWPKSSASRSAPSAAPARAAVSPRTTSGRSGRLPPKRRRWSRSRRNTTSMAASSASP